MRRKPKFGKKHSPAPADTVVTHNAETPVEDRKLSEATQAKIATTVSDIKTLIACVKTSGVKIGINDLLDAADDIITSNNTSALRDKIMDCYAHGMVKDKYIMIVGHLNAILHYIKTIDELLVSDGVIDRAEDIDHVISVDGGRFEFRYTTGREWDYRVFETGVDASSKYAQPLIQHVFDTIRRLTDENKALKAKLSDMEDKLYEYGIK